MKTLAVILVIGVFVLGAPLLALATIVISEILYDPAGSDTDKEWIELYNSEPSDIYLYNYSIRDNQYPRSILAGTKISGRDVLVIAEDANIFYTLWGFYPDVIINLPPLGNSGDFLKLLKDTEEIDLVAWEGFLTGWEDVEADPGESIQRWSLGYGPDAWLSNRTPNPGSPAPIPEPSSLLLLVSGLFGLAGLGWRLRNR